jgi:hypothetical protein
MKFSFFFLYLSFSSWFPFISASSVVNYDTRQLYANVWLSGASYCNKNTYETMKIGGEYASSFIWKQTLYDFITDAQGFIGILPDTETIHVVIRGSYSVRNWIDDLEIKQTPYFTYPECNCNVHWGFYNSALNIRNTTIETVKELQIQYPTYSVVVTGHSYGAAVGQLLAMELEKENIRVQLYNYGQPRVGDIEYAMFVNTILRNYWRVTHNRDIVPHVPPKKIVNIQYLHSCTEIFENEMGELTLCSSTDSEDIQCSNQFSLKQTDIRDHEYYLQHQVSCGKSLM